MIAMMPSPPGWFSTTTGLPQRAERRSANSRAMMSVPLPGPSGRISFTGRVGHACALRGGRLRQIHQAQQDRESENRSAHGVPFPF